MLSRFRGSQGCRDGRETSLLNEVIADSKSIEDGGPPYQPPQRILWTDGHLCMRHSNTATAVSQFHPCETDVQHYAASIRPPATINAPAGGPLVMAAAAAPWLLEEDPPPSLPPLFLGYRSGLNAVAAARASTWVCRAAAGGVDIRFASVIRIGKEDAGLTALRG